MNRPLRKLPLLALAALVALVAVPALALPGGLTVGGVITKVDGNLVTLNGIIAIDVTHATILARGDGGATGVAALQVGAPASAEISGKGTDGSLIATTMIVGSAQGIELRGTIDAVDTTKGTLTLLGLTVTTDAHTAFTGATARGPVRSLADLKAGDAVSVEAIRSGTTLLAQHVHGEAAQPPSGGGQHVRFLGTVESIGATSWKISGKTVQVTASTEIEGSPAVGDTVMVNGTIAADGTITANSIQKATAPAGGQQEIHGTLQVKNADSWTISGTVVKITSATVIKNDPKVGDFVAGMATKASDGTLTATVLVGMGSRGGGMGSEGNGRH